MSDSNSTQHSPAFTAAYEQARQGGAFRGLPSQGQSSIAHSDQGMPVSREVMAHRASEYVRAKFSASHDFKNDVIRSVEGVSSDSDPAGYLRNIGYAAVNSRGEEVIPTPEQARQIAAAVLRNAAMNADYPGAATGVSANDPALPAHLARVTGRRLY